MPKKFAVLLYKLFEGYVMGYVGCIVDEPYIDQQLGKGVSIYSGAVISEGKNNFIIPFGDLT